MTVNDRYNAEAVVWLMEFSIEHDQQFKDNPLHAGCRKRIEEAITKLLATGPAVNQIVDTIARKEILNER